MYILLLTCTSVVCVLGLLCLYACYVRRRGVPEDDEDNALNYNVVGDTIVM